LKTLNDELKKKIENLQEKYNEMKKRLEIKLQEKEFKIVTMKQQMKQLTHSGLLTPVSASQPQHNNLSFSTHKDVVNMISEMIKQQI